ncbi:MAG: molybdopterin-dependent oxidoreductase [Longimicrobiales bacterium]
MIPFHSFGLVILLGLGSAAPAVSEQLAPTLELVSLDGRTRALTAAELVALAPSEATATEEGGSAVYRGPGLRDLATLAGAPAGRTLRGPAMSLVLLAEGSDGYRVAIALAEVDPQFGAVSALAALTRNGEPLAQGDGPIRLVVPGDGFHARWVRGLVRVRIVDAAALGDTTPAR